MSRTLTSFYRRSLNKSARRGVSNSLFMRARSVWLSSLSPKENREIPPLDYARVYRQQEYPHLAIAINGGITHMDDILRHLQQVDGVMVGREAYQNLSVG